MISDAPKLCPEHSFADLHSVSSSYDDDDCYDYCCCGPLTDVGASLAAGEVSSDGNLTSLSH